MVDNGEIGQPRLASNRSARWAFMDRFEVPQYDGDGTYLTRWRVIQTPWFGLYVHRFTGPDPRPTLHDHPWSFRSLVLKGGYIEATEYARHASLPVNWRGQDIPTDSLRRHGAWTTLRRWTWNHKAAGDAHTIVRLLSVPTWTLLLVGPRVRQWGYTDPDGTWTPFDQHRHNDEFVAALARRKEAARG